MRVYRLTIVELSSGGERNGERVPTYTERPGCLLGPGWGGVEEREVVIALALDNLWPVMEEPGARLLAELLRQTAIPNSTFTFGVASGGGHSSGVVVELISLADNALGPLGGVALSRALPACPKLMTLDLRSNQLGNDGAIALAQVLAQCKWLQVLRLGNNQIGDDGAVALAETLLRFGSGGEVGDRCALRELGLARNLITDIGAEVLSRALELTASLRSVELDGNPLGMIRSPNLLAVVSKDAIVNRRLEMFWWKCSGLAQVRRAVRHWAARSGRRRPWTCGCLERACAAAGCRQCARSARKVDRDPFVPSTMPWSSLPWHRRQSWPSDGASEYATLLGRSHEAWWQCLAELIGWYRGMSLVFRATEHCEAGRSFSDPAHQSALRVTLDKARVGLHQQQERNRLATCCPLCERGGTADLCPRHQKEKRLGNICPECEDGGRGDFCEKHLFQHPQVCRAKGLTPLQCKENGTPASALHAIAYSEQPPHANGLERGKPSNVTEGMQLLITERDDRNGGTADSRGAQFGTVVSVGAKGRLTVQLEHDGREEEFWISGHSSLKPRKKHGILERLQVYRFVYLLDKWRAGAPESELVAGTRTVDSR